MMNEQTGSKIAEIDQDVPDALTLQQLEHMLSDIRFQPKWREEAARCADYYDGNQLTEERLGRMEKLGIPPLVTNLIAPAVNTMLGMEAKTRTDWRVTQENEVQEVPELMLDAMNAKLNEAERETRADRAISDAYAGQLKSGIGWVEVSRSTDALDYPYRVASVHRDEMYGDFFKSKKPDLSDARYLIRKRTFDQDILISMMPEHADVITWAIGDKFRSWQWDTKSQISTRLAYAAHLERITNIDHTEWRSAERKRATLFEVWYRTWKRDLVMRLPTGNVIPFDRTNPQHVEAVSAGLLKPYMASFSTMRVAFYMGCHRLYDFASPYKHRHFPYVPFWGFREDLTGIPYGIVRAMMSPQDVVNSADSKMHWMLNSRRLRADSDAIDRKYNTWENVRENLARSDSIVLLDPSKPNARFKEENDTGLNAQQFQRRLQAAQDVQAASGIFRAQEGRDNNANSGVQEGMRIEQGNLSMAEINDNYMYARRQVGELLFSMVREDLMHDEVPVMVKKDGKRNLVVLNQRTPEGILNPVASVPCKVVLEDVPSTPAFRAQQLKLMTELTSKLPPQFQVALMDMVIKMTDVPDKDQVIDRLKKLGGIPEEMTPEQQAQAAQAQALEQQKQQQIIEAQVKLALEKAAAENELLKAKVAQVGAQNKKIDMDRVEQAVTAMYEALQAGQVVATVQGIAPVADEILKGAGFKADPNGVDPNIPSQDARAQMMAQQGMNSTLGTNIDELKQSDGIGKGIETMRNDGAQPQIQQ